MIDGRHYHETEMLIVLLSTLGLPFAITATDEQPQENKNKTKQKKTEKNVINICNRRSSLTGHILCIGCKQWQNFKCVGLNTSMYTSRFKYKYPCKACIKSAGTDRLQLLE